MENFQLLSSYEYIKDATQQVKKAKRRVYSLSPILAPDSSTDSLISSLNITAKRGLDVNIAVDAFSYSELAGSFTFNKHLHPASIKMNQMLSTLSSNGAEVHILNNRKKLNPFSGVTHIKWLVVDDLVYSFGGVNLYQKGIESIDYMLKINDPALADSLINEHKKIIKKDHVAKRYAGLESDLPYGKLLIDNGKKNSSIIYEHTLSLAKKSKSIALVSQYCPTGKLAKILKEIPSRLYFNPPKVAHATKNKILIKSSMLRTSLKTDYKKKSYIHAKFIIFTLKNGKKAAITGSHNFVYGGVKLGTKEVALETTNQTIINSLEGFLEEDIA